MAADSFDFSLIGNKDAPFVGYISAEDPTKVSPQALVRGSQNVILKDTGDIANRPGKKRYDPADDSDDPVVASYDWQDVDGDQLLVRVLQSGALQFYRTTDSTWYTITTFDTANTDVSFAKWWDATNAKELLLMANGTNAIHAWAGGTTDGVGEVNTANSILMHGSPFLLTLSFDGNVPSGMQAVVGLDGQFNSDNSLAAIVLEENLTGSEFLIISTTSNITALNVTAYIQFVDTLTSPATPENAIVLKGATKEETAANLLALLQNPSANTATQNGFTDGDVIQVFGLIDSEATQSLETGGEETWLEQGFINNSSIIVDGTEYTYDLVAGNYLVNISGFPTEGEFAYSGLASSSNIPVADYLTNFILVLNNQLMTFSYTSRVVYISADTSYLDFSNLGSLIPGDPDSVVLDEFPKGGTVGKDSVYVGAGTNAWYVITPNTPVPVTIPSTDWTPERLVIVEVQKFNGAGLTAPLGFNFVTTNGEDILFLDQQNQLRTLGFYRNFNTQKSPSLSILVRAELQEEDFTGGQLRAIGEYTYLVAPISGKVYLYEIRDDVDEVGNITSERHWQPPQTWNISRLAIVNGIAHGYSAENPQLYQLWDTDIWYDETATEDIQAPYISVARFAYRVFDKNRMRLGRFNRVAYEGYILPQSDLTATVYYDYRGATHIATNVLSDYEVNPVEFGETGVTLIGGQVIGNTTLGGGRRDVDYPNPLPKFRAITNVPVHDCFEYQLELVSENIGSQWELVALGANSYLSTDNPVNLQLTT